MAKGIGSIQVQSNEDLDIEIEIQKELDALKIEDLDEFEDGVAVEEKLGQPGLAVHDKDVEKDVQKYTADIDEYLKIIHLDEHKTNRNLREAEEMLEKSEKDLSNGIDKLLEEKLKYEFSSNGEALKCNRLLQLRTEALAEIEELDLEEEKEFATTATQDNDLAIDIIRPDFNQEIEKFEKEERAKLKELRDKQKKEERQQAEIIIERKEKELMLEEESNKRSLLRLETVQKSMKKFQECEREISMQSEEHNSLLKEIEKEFEREVKEIERIRENELQEYKKMRNEIEMERRKKRSDAAVVIQKRFRGFRVRKLFKPRLEHLKAARITKKNQKLEEERLEKERLEKERLEKERLEKERLEKERLEKERLEKERLEKERLEKERLEKEKLEKERIEKERLEKERLAKEKLEKERLEKEKLAKDRLKKERLEQERLEKERLEKERLEKERLEEERLEKERIEKEWLEKERLEKEKLEKERLEKEKLANDRLKKERLEQERLEKERLEKDRLAKERVEKERLSKERLYKEKLERERLEKERHDRDRIQKEKLEKEKNDKEKLEADGLEEERHSKENTEKDDFSENTSYNQMLNLSLPESIEKKRQEWMDSHTSFSVSTDYSRRQPVSRSRPRTNYRKAGSSNSLPNLTSSQMLQFSPDGSTLNTIECIIVKDIDGACMQSIKTCPNIKTIILENCGIETLEGVDNCSHLRSMDLRRNRIDSVILSRNSCLRKLLLSKNNLSSVNGLECLVNLEVLDLSSNRITRVGSLSSCTRLQDLNLSENQLISLKGIENLQRLVRFNAAKNHLSNAKEIVNLALLDSLDIHGNTVQSVPSLKNHVLLRELILDENNIKSLQQLSDCWLPSLEILSVSGNSLEELPSLDHLIMLNTIDLRDNLIKECEDLLSGIKNCTRLSRLLISGNPVEGIPDMRSHIQSKLINLTLLDELQLKESKSSHPPVSYIFENLCMKQRLESKEVFDNYRRDLKSIESVSNLHDRELRRLNIEECYVKSRFNLMLKHLYEHEHFGKDDAAPWSEGVQELDYAKETVLISLNTVETDGKESHPQIDMKYGAENPDSSEISKDSKESKMRDLSDIEDKDHSKTWSNHHEKAATKIQALYRGYRLRRALYAAMTSAHHQGGGNDDDDDFDYDEEVDLSAFDFDDVHHEWKPTSPCQPPPSTPALMHEERSEQKGIADVPKYAWRSQPATPDASVHHVERLNLEFSPEESEATMTIPESGASRKQEEILVEWGLQNATTADLMLKRAKRMNAAARKKDMMTPDKRYALFKKMHKTNPNITVRPPSKKKTTERMDYFAAQKETNSSTKLSGFSNESDYKQQMTYSWVCNQTVLHTDAHQDILNGQAQDVQTKPDKKQSFRSKENVSLPYLDPAIIAGKSVPLVILSTRDHKNSTSESPKNRKSSLDCQGIRRHSTEKSRSAPDPSNRSPHVFSCNTTASSRSSSSGSSRGKTKKRTNKR